MSTTIIILGHISAAQLYYNGFPQYSRLSGPPTLLKNEDAIGPGAAQLFLHKLFANIKFYVISTYLSTTLCIFCQASLFLCPISLPLITPRHLLSIPFVCTISGALVKWCLINSDDESEEFVWRCLRFVVPKSNRGPSPF